MCETVNSHRLRAMLGIKSVSSFQVWSNLLFYTLNLQCTLLLMLCNIVSFRVFELSYLNRVKVQECLSSATTAHRSSTG